MTPSEHRALETLQEEIDRERARADCPCVRALLVILSKGLENIAEAGQEAGNAAHTTMVRAASARGGRPTSRPRRWNC